MDGSAVGRMGGEEEAAQSWISIPSSGVCHLIADAWSLSETSWKKLSVQQCEGEETIKEETEEEQERRARSWP